MYAIRSYYGTLRLDFLHGLDQFGRTAGIADAPAGHGVCLGDTVQDDGTFVEFRADIEDIAEGFLAPEDMLVHVVSCNQHT